MKKKSFLLDADRSVAENEQKIKVHTVSVHVHMSSFTQEVYRQQDNRERVSFSNRVELQYRLN